MRPAVTSNTPNSPSANCLPTDAMLPTSVCKILMPPPTIAAMMQPTPIRTKLSSMPKAPLRKTASRSESLRSSGLREVRRAVTLVAWRRLDASLCGVLMAPGVRRLANARPGIEPWNNDPINIQTGGFRLESLLYMSTIGQDIADGPRMRRTGRSRLMEVSQFQRFATAVLRPAARDRVCSAV